MIFPTLKRDPQVCFPKIAKIEKWFQLRISCRYEGGITPEKIWDLCFCSELFVCLRSSSVFFLMRPISRNFSLFGQNLHHVGSVVRGNGTSAKFLRGAFDLKSFWCLYLGGGPSNLAISLFPTDHAPPMLQIYHFILFSPTLWPTRSPSLEGVGQRSSARFARIRVYTIRSSYRSSPKNVTVGFESFLDA